MNDVNPKAKQKALLYAMIFFFILMIVTEWYATQKVAADCDYNKLLGWNFCLGNYHIYPPWGYFLWSSNEHLANVIPNVLRPYNSITIICGTVSAIVFYIANKSLTVHTEHGSASFATKKDIEDSGLGEVIYKTISKSGSNPKKVKVTKDSGVVIGINPYTHKLMLHDGVEHILLMAPTRSGKGVCTIVPTGLIWKHSIFFFDPKGELWGLTSGYRKYVLKQKVLKFQPLCKDGSAARWNPLAEINYRSFEELSDVQSIVSVMVRPDGEQKGGDSFWPDSAAALLNGVILHLLYQHDREKLPLPCPTDIMSFLSSPDKSTEELFTYMKNYPHISPEEFLEVPIKDENGNIVYDENGIIKRKKNVLKEIYGEYIKDFRIFSKELGIPVHSLDEIRVAIQYKLDHNETIIWNAVNEDDIPTESPYYMLLTHPKVAECASNMLNGAEQTRASIMQTAQTAMAIYQDPVVQANTAVSDFAIRDLLDPKQEVSLYLVMEVKDIATVKPIARLFLQTLCAKLIQDMKFGKEAKNLKKQRLLLMLDEFPQLGNMKCIELALAICAGYGIKMCIVCQDVNQLNKEYTKDNSIGSNCHLHIYFTPNIDSGGATAESISKQLGKKTISTVSHSDGGGGFFKGSDSTSSTGRELMTPDEVSHMSSEKELVFVAGHKPILGDKLRYYLQPWLLKRTQIEHPAISDTVTRITDYKTMFEIKADEIASKQADRMNVLSEQAKQAGCTLAQLLKNKDEERLKNEAMFIKKIKGNDELEKKDLEEQKNDQFAEKNSDFAGNKREETLTTVYDSLKQAVPAVTSSKAMLNRRFQTVLDNLINENAVNTIKNNDIDGSSAIAKNIANEIDAIADSLKDEKTEAANKKAESTNEKKSVDDNIENMINLIDMFN